MSGEWQPIETWHGVEFVDQVLIGRDHGKRCVLPAIFDGEKWQAITIAGLMPFLNPTHWMPLPEPPETNDVG